MMQPGRPLFPFRKGRKGGGLSSESATELLRMIYFSLALLFLLPMLALIGLVVWRAWQ